MEMNTRTIREFRWFWAWDDDKEEDWLREKSNQGFHLIKVSLPGIYTFEEGLHKDYVYRLDYSPDIKKKEDYLNLFCDAGWVYLGSQNYWQYFRKEVTGSMEPEIFTDNESKTIKYKRIISLLAAILPLTVVNLINCIDRADQPFWLFLSGFFSFFMILIAYGLWKLFRRIKEIKRL